jgi:hypothetical protein
VRFKFGRIAGVAADNMPTKPASLIKEIKKTANIEKRIINPIQEKKPIMHTF